MAGFSRRMASRFSSPPGREEANRDRASIEEPLLHDEGRVEEFEGLRKPWRWPDGWKTGSGWLKWHPKWLRKTTLCDLDEFCPIGGVPTRPENAPNPSD